MVSASAAAPSLADRALPPGPAWPSAVQLWHWVYRPDQLLERCAARFGDTFTLRFPRFPAMVVTCDPALVREVFGAPDRFAAGRANALLRPTLGDGSLMLLDGAAHVDERRRLLPGFQGPRVADLAEPIREAARRTLDRWPVGGEVVVHREMKRITRDVVLRAVLGLAPGHHADDVGAAIEHLVDVGNRPLFTATVDEDGHVRGRAWQAWLSGSPWSRLARAHRDVDHHLMPLIAARRAGDQGPDVASMLAAATDAAGAPLTDRAIRDELITLIVAGHKTTATALTWAVHHVARDPGLWDRLRAEVDAADPSGLDRAVDEAQRLHPALPLVLRQAVGPERLGAWALPAGARVAPSSWLAHRRAAAWPDPLRFDPERFRVRPAPELYFPFGGGARRCLGRAFAVFEMRAVLSELLLRRRLVVSPDHSPRVARRGITFGLADGLPVRVVG